MHGGRLQRTVKIRVQRQEDTRLLRDAQVNKVGSTGAQAEILSFFCSRTAIECAFLEPGVASGVMAARLGRGLEQ